MKAHRMKTEIYIMIEKWSLEIRDCPTRLFGCFWFI